uniref:Uncharacterized protein n=1 Tax=Arundo donax TaxID=35708 RepID=A0A0A9CBS3_ARUDO
MFLCRDLFYWYPPRKLVR